MRRGARPVHTTTGLLLAFDKDLAQTALQNAAHASPARRAARKILDEAENRRRTEQENYFKRAGFEQVEFR